MTPLQGFIKTHAYHAVEDTDGGITVSLKEVESGELDPISPDMKPGPYACLTVADTGVGMDTDVMEKIFDPFFTTKEKGKETGMGLSVIHGIVKSAGGCIKLISQRGNGSTFQVYLPVVARRFEHQGADIQEALQRGTERILLVDDGELIATMEKQMLERLGYQVVPRVSSVEAL